jgi:hypothetical protein
VLKKDGIVISGLIAILIVVVMASGCTSTPKETVVKELDVGYSPSAMAFDVPITSTVYVNVPSDAKIRVEISNVTVIPNSYKTHNPSLSFNGLDVEGQYGQPVGNYQGHLKDVKNFNNLTNGFTGNSTFSSGLKSIGIVSKEVTAHIKIVAIT